MQVALTRTRIHVLTECKTVIYLANQMIAFKNIAPLQRVITFEHRSFQTKYQVFRTNTTVFTPLVCACHVYVISNSHIFTGLMLKYINKTSSK
jgi:hypothetical protein